MDGQPPNLVVFLLDDLDETTTRPFFGEVMPNFTALERAGVRFEQAFVPTSICCPSRASILTGRLGHNTDVLTNGGYRGGWENFQDEDGTLPGSIPLTISAALAEAGYRTGLVGKYMNGYGPVEGELPPVPEGWSDWHAILGGGYTGYDYRLLEVVDGGAPSVGSYGSSAEDYSTDVFRDRALQFLEDSHAASAPAFLYFAPTAPHAPLPPAPRHEERARQWTCDTLPGHRDRPNFFSDGASFADKPDWLRRTANARSVPGIKAYNCMDWRNRLGSLYAADEALAAIVSKLEELDEWDRTLLVVLSDNGYNLGAHSLIHKMAPYEESIRVPFFINGGAGLDLDHGWEVSYPALNIDIAPTFREAAGLAIDPDSDGRSLLGIARGQAPAAWRTAMPLEYEGSGWSRGITAELPPVWHYYLAPPIARDIPTYRGVRTFASTPGERELKLIEWPRQQFLPGMPDHEYEVYDLTNDPFELRNLLKTAPLHGAAIKHELLPRLEALARCQGADCWH